MMGQAGLVWRTMVERLADRTWLARLAAQPRGANMMMLTPMRQMAAPV